MDNQLRKTTLLTRTRFNPRPCMRGDLGSDDSRIDVGVSIPPPHGGRRRLGLSWCPSARFNPRPHTGGDYKIGAYFFQQASFNPRPHTGATVYGSEINVIKFVSIHAPTRGRPSSIAGSWIYSVSIHAPTRGRHELSDNKEPQNRVSIHAPTRGRQ